MWRSSKDLCGTFRKLCVKVTIAHTIFMRFAQSSMNASSLSKTPHALQLSLHIDQTFTHSSFLFEAGGEGPFSRPDGVGFRHSEESQS